MEIQTPNDEKEKKLPEQSDDELEMGEIRQKDQLSNKKPADNLGSIQECSHANFQSTKNINQFEPNYITRKENFVNFEGFYIIEQEESSYFNDEILEEAKHLENNTGIITKPRKFLDFKYFNSEAALKNAYLADINKVRNAIENVESFIFKNPLKQNYRNCINCDYLNYYQMLKFRSLEEVVLYLKYLYENKLEFYFSDFINFEKNLFDFISLENFLKIPLLRQNFKAIKFICNTCLVDFLNRGSGILELFKLLDDSIEKLMNGYDPNQVMDVNKENVENDLTENKIKICRDENNESEENKYNKNIFYFDDKSILISKNIFQDQSNKISKNCVSVKPIQNNDLENEEYFSNFHSNNFNNLEKFLNYNKIQKNNHEKETNIVNDKYIHSDTIQNNTQKKLYSASNNNLNESANHNHYNFMNDSNYIEIKIESEIKSSFSYSENNLVRKSGDLKTNKILLKKSSSQSEKDIENIDNHIVKDFFLEDNNQSLNKIHYSKLKTNLNIDNRISDENKHPKTNYLKDQKDVIQFNTEAEDKLVNNLIVNGVLLEKNKNIEPLNILKFSENRKNNKFNFNNSSNNLIDPTQTPNIASNNNLTNTRETYKASFLDLNIINDKLISLNDVAKVTNNNNNFLNNNFMFHNNGMTNIINSSENNMINPNLHPSSELKKSEKKNKLEKLNFMENIFQNQIIDSNTDSFSDSNLPSFKNTKNNKFEENQDLNVISNIIFQNNSTKENDINNLSFLKDNLRKNSSNNINTSMNGFSHSHSNSNINNVNDANYLLLKDNSFERNNYIKFEELKFLEDDPKSKTKISNITKNSADLGTINDTNKNEAILNHSQNNKNKSLASENNLNNNYVNSLKNRKVNKNNNNNIGDKSINKDKINQANKSSTELERLDLFKANNLKSQSSNDQFDINKNDLNNFLSDLSDNKVHKKEEEEEEDTHKNTTLNLATNKISNINNQPTSGNIHIPNNNTQISHKSNQNINNMNYNFQFDNSNSNINLNQNVNKIVNEETPINSYHLLQNNADNYQSNLNLNPSMTNNFNYPLYNTNDFLSFNKPILNQAVRQNDSMYNNEINNAIFDKKTNANSTTFVFKSINDLKSQNSLIQEFSHIKKYEINDFYNSIDLCVNKFNDDLLKSFHNFKFFDKGSFNNHQTIDYWNSNEAMCIKGSRPHNNNDKALLGNKRLHSDFSLRLMENMPYKEFNEINREKPIDEIEQDIFKNLDFSMFEGQFNAKSNKNVINKSPGNYFSEQNNSNFHEQNYNYYEHNRNIMPDLGFDRENKLPFAANFSNFNNNLTQKKLYSNFNNNNSVCNSNNIHNMNNINILNDFIPYSKAETLLENKKIDKAKYEANNINFNNFSNLNNNFNINHNYFTYVPPDQCNNIHSEKQKNKQDYLYNSFSSKPMNYNNSYFKGFEENNISSNYKQGKVYSSIPNNNLNPQKNFEFPNLSNESSCNNFFSYNESLNNKNLKGYGPGSNHQYQDVNYPPHIIMNANNQNFKLNNMNGSFTDPYQKPN